MVLQNPMSTLPLLVGEISDHLNNFPFNFSDDLFVGFISKSLDIKNGASHILVQPG
jgi:hypothetical protein